MAELKTVTREVTELAEHLTRGQSDTFRLVLAGRLQDALDACQLVVERDPAHPLLCVWCDQELDDDPERSTTTDGELIHRDPCLDELVEDNRRVAREGPTRDVFRLHAPGCTLGRSHPFTNCHRQVARAQCATPTCEVVGETMARPHHPRCCVEDREHLGDYCTVPDDDEVDLTGVSARG